MRFGHLLVRCGPHRVLVPGDNVAAIEEMSDLTVTTTSILRARQPGWPLVLDTRILLCFAPADRAAPRVAIHWHSSDGSRRAILVVDAVDGLRHDDDVTLPLPRVPLSFRALFDGLVANGGDTFLLRLRNDVRPLLDTFAHRRDFVRAVLGASPPDNISNHMGS